MRIWEQFLTDTDREILSRDIRGKPRGQPTGLGDSPALVIVDVQYLFVGDNKPVLEQLDAWPFGCGEAGWKAIRNIKQLIGVAREAGIPIIYNEIRYPADNKLSAWVKGSKMMGPIKDEELQIVSDIAPRPEDIIIPKGVPSPFAHTPMITYLNKLGIDTLIVTGVRTSACVRALVVDAFSNLFRVAVVEDCVFDQMEVSHATALLDMWLIYADIINLKEAIDYIKAIKVQH